MKPGSPVADDLAIDAYVVVLIEISAGPDVHHESVAGVGGAKERIAHVADKHEVGESGCRRQRSLVIHDPRASSWSEDGDHTASKTGIRSLAVHFGERKQRVLEPMDIAVPAEVILDDLL